MLRMLASGALRDVVTTRAAMAALPATVVCNLMCLATFVILPLGLCGIFYLTALVRWISVFIGLLALGYAWQALMPTWRFNGFLILGVHCPGISVDSVAAHVSFTAECCRRFRAALGS